MNCSIPNMPRFEIVNVPSSRSAPLQLAVARPADEVGAGGGDLLDRAPVGVADHRHDEAVRRGDGDADVRVREAQDRLAREVRVDGRMAHERGGTDLRQQVADGRLRLALPQARRRARSRSSSARVMSTRDA